MGATRHPRAAHHPHGGRQTAFHSLPVTKEPSHSQVKASVDFREFFPLVSRRRESGGVMASDATGYRHRCSGSGWARRCSTAERCRRGDIRCCRVLPGLTCAGPSLPELEVVGAPHARLAVAPWAVPARRRAQAAAPPGAPGAPGAPDLGCVVTADAELGCSIEYPGPAWNTALFAIISTRHADEKRLSFAST